MKKEKIYTYYENVNFKKQPELIDVWKQSWTAGGFEPIVLGRDDAMKSPLYDDYYDFVQRVHKKSTGVELLGNTYYLAAQLEIVAFTTVDEPSFFSDYDVICNGYIPFTPEDKVNWLNKACSCFVTGSKVGWDEYVYFLFENEDLIADHCKQEHQKTNRSRFHDQDFLVAVYDKGIESGVFKGSRNLDVIGDDYKINSENICKAIHISHKNAHEIKESYSKWLDTPIDDVRLFYAREVLNNLLKSKA